jgi:UDP:flavonoid glycosyltransferase YjiC (YdhE family)
MVSELDRACDGADVLISLPYQLAGAITHDLLQIPLVAVHLSPFGGHSRRFAAETAAQINELRASYGLVPVSDPLSPGEGSPLLSLCAVSPLLFPRPRRWSSNCHLTGFLFLEEPWTPDPELAQFMDAGDPPVVITFGSMPHLSPREVADIVMIAIRQVGMRAVVQRGWTGLQFETLPEAVRLVDFVPHQWLFPRAACVVHAGGAGTTAATVLAGVPSVVVPHMLDQFLWAALLWEQGCSSDTIPYAELGASRLAGAINRALVPASLDHVSRLSAEIARENGACAAASLIESYLSPPGSAPARIPSPVED